MFPSHVYAKYVQHISACVVQWVKWWRRQMPAFVCVRVCVYVSKMMNIAWFDAWCAGVCGRMWAVMLARAPSIHVTSHSWLSTFSRTFTQNIYSTFLRPRTLQKLIIVSALCKRKLAEDLEQRIRVWALTLPLNKRIVKEIKNCCKTECKQSLPRAMIES